LVVPDPPLPFLRSKEDAVSFSVANGNTIWIRAGAHDTGGGYTLMEARQVAGTGPPLHTHEAEDETFYVLGGSYSFWIGEDVLRGSAGDIFFVPRLVAHRFRCETAGHMLLLYTPGGFEAFFADRASEEKTHGRSLEPGELDAIGRRHGMRVVSQQADLRGQRNRQMRAPRPSSAQTGRMAEDAQASLLRSRLG
jgi:mannose-6-phosphate isomerase-like protein (cupin superfamily)